MKRKRHSPGEIIKKLRDAQEALAAGKTVEVACRAITVGKWEARPANSEAVAHVCHRLEASVRRACKSLGQARSSQRYKPKPREEDIRLTAAIRRIAVREPRAGYRDVRRHLTREGWQVNPKRVHRIWKKGSRCPPRHARSAAPVTPPTARSVSRPNA